MSRAPYELTSVRRTFVLFFTLVVLPSASLSGFGVLAIKNERAAVEKSLEQSYSEKLRVLEEQLHVVLDETARDAPLPGTDRPTTPSVAGRDRLLVPLFLLDIEGRVLTRGEGAPALESPDREALQELLKGMPADAVLPLRVEGGLLDGVLLALRTGAETAVWRVDEEQLAQSFPALARARFPAEEVSWVLQQVEPPRPASGPAGLFGMVADVVRDPVERADAAIAVRRLSAPLSDWEIAAVGPESVRAVSRRNRIIYLSLLVVFYGTLATGLVMFARAMVREARLSRLKTDFVSAISHDLRTPLTSIRMFVETLAMGRARDSEETRECLELLARESERLSVMIERMLDWARIESGRKIYRRLPVRPEEIVEVAVASFRTQLMASGARPPSEEELLVQVPQGLPAVEADAQALGGVLLNLVHNAWKYTGADKQVTVRARAEDKRVHFEVQDNGPGVAKRDLKRVFEQFYRADDLLTRRTEGTGLGLSIAKRVVEAHGGRMQVRSLPGRGSTFGFWLPRAER